MPAGSGRRESVIPDMDLNALLREKQPAITAKWFESVLAAYPENTANIYRKSEAPFTNPVGYNARQGVEGLFDALLKGVMLNEASAFLDAIVRVRAVQQFPPSQALSFIYELKKIVRAEIGAAAAEQGLTEDLDAFLSTIDDLALFAFDLYMGCREKLFEIKVNEMKNSTFRLIQQANRAGGKQE